MFLFFLHNHKSYLLLSVCLIGYNLSRSCQDGVCNVLSVLFDYRCKRKAELMCHFCREAFMFIPCMNFHAFLFLFHFLLLFLVCMCGETLTNRHGGGGGGGVSKLNCHHQNDFCIKMDSRESNLRRPFTCLPCKPLITIYKLNLY